MQFTKTVQFLISKNSVFEIKVLFWFEWSVCHQTFWGHSRIEYGFESAHLDVEGEKTIWIFFNANVKTIPDFILL